MDQICQSGKCHIVTTASEEAPIHLLGKHYEKLGVYQKKVSLNCHGQMTREALEAVLSPKIGALSLSWANGLTGVIHPILELAELCKEKGILVHVDASQVLGKLYLQFAELPIDYFTFEGTLIHGPRGSGALFASKGIDFTPNVPEGMPGAELNVPSFIGLGIAAEETSQNFEQLSLEVPRLRDLLEEGVCYGLPDVHVLYQEVERLPNVSAMSFPGVHHELLAFHLREAGVYASFGGGQKQKLEYLTHDPSALSFSLSRETTEEEIHRATSIIVDAVQKCQTFSREVSL